MGILENSNLDGHRKQSNKSHSWRACVDPSPPEELSARKERRLDSSRISELQ